jgi:hypothetical protein
VAQMHDSSSGQTDGQAACALARLNPAREPIAASGLRPPTAPSALCALAEAQRERKVADSKETRRTTTSARGVCAGLGV